MWEDDCTHPSRFERGATLLTLCAQGTGAGMTNTRSIQDSQGPIVFGTSFLEIQGMIGGAPQHAIRLRSKHRTRETMRKRGCAHCGGPYVTGGVGTTSRAGTSVEGVSTSRGSKFGGTQLGWRDLLA